MPAAAGQAGWSQLSGKPKNFTHWEGSTMTDQQILDLKQKLNENDIIVNFCNGRKPINAKHQTKIEEQIRNLLNHLSDEFPEDWQKRFNIPIETLELIKKFSIPKDDGYYPMAKSFFDKGIVHMLNRADILVYLAIRHHCDYNRWDIGKTFVSNLTVQKMTALNHKTVKTSIRKLKDLGILTNLQRHKSRSYHKEMKIWF